MNFTAKNEKRNLEKLDSSESSQFDENIQKSGTTKDIVGIYLVYCALTSPTNVINVFFETFLATLVVLV